MKKRRRIHVEGIVQGVGFRPFVFRLASGLDLAGWVTNTSAGVLIEVEGPPGSLEIFTDTLRDDPPPLADITGLSTEELPASGYRDFTIRPSLALPDRTVLVSPDTAVCPDCRRELLDPADRRHRYPFINCTNCGPRYTIIRRVPYDRPNTSMAPFRMCARCRAEYDDPGDRRYHAQPNGCFDCGPSLTLLDASGRLQSGEPLEGALTLLRNGRIVAVKGLGGYHLAVDPRSSRAVARLRERKGREEKPFALMVRDLETARLLCHTGEVAEMILSSTESPIALLPRKKDPGLALAPEVAPKSRYMGLMLPYTPLHILLMEEFDALVMTSANISEEPLCAGNEEAVRRLAGIADAYLTHDREIVLRCDDSIVRLTPDDPTAGPTVLRRARGFVPAPVSLPIRSEASVLALGPELKGSVCLTRGGRAYIGQHLGDMKNVETEGFLKEVTAHLLDILQVVPGALVCDLHPDYLTTRLAQEGTGAPWPGGLPVYRVQHHHAHVLSTQAESGLAGASVGVALDGTGYGTDGTIWGGEVLLVDGTRMERQAHLKPVWMPGGEKAIENPGRMTMSLLVEAHGARDALRLAETLFPGREEEMELVAAMVEKRVHGIWTSSAGRLFDAFSALLDVCQKARYEGQPAIELEVLTDAGVTDILPYSLAPGENGCLQLDMVPAFASAAEARLRGEDPARLAGMFHRTLARAMAELVQQAFEASDLNGEDTAIPVSGGVFQNEVFCSWFAEEMLSRSLEPVFHRLVPTNDGGVSLGQAYYGLLALHEEV